MENIPPEINHAIGKECASGQEFEGYLIAMEREVPAWFFETLYPSSTLPCIETVTLRAKNEFYPPPSALRPYVLIVMQARAWDDTACTSSRSFLRTTPAVKTLRLKNGDALILPDSRRPFGWMLKLKWSISSRQDQDPIRVPSHLRFWTGNHDNEWDIELKVLKCDLAVLSNKAGWIARDVGQDGWVDLCGNSGTRRECVNYLRRRTRGCFLARARAMTDVSSLIPFFIGVNYPTDLRWSSIRGTFRNNQDGSGTEELHDGLILDGRGTTRIRWEQNLHGGGRYLVELLGLGRAAVSEVRVGTSSRSDLLSELQAEVGAQPYATSRQALNVSAVLRWWYMRLLRFAVDGDFEDYIPVLGAAIYATRRMGSQTDEGSTNSMDGWRTNSVVSVAERCRSENDHRGCFEAVAGTYRHKWVASQDTDWRDVNGNPMSLEELAAEAGSDTTGSNEFAVSMRRAKARTSNILNRGPPIGVALPRVTDGVRVFGRHKQLAVSYMNRALQQSRIYEKLSFFPVDNDERQQRPKRSDLSSQSTARSYYHIPRLPPHRLVRRGTFNSKPWIWRAGRAGHRFRVRNRASMWNRGVPFSGQRFNVYWQHIVLSHPYCCDHPVQHWYDLNTDGVDGGNTLVDHEVTADYAQGMLTCTRGGSPICITVTLKTCNAQSWLVGSLPSLEPRIWRFERLSTQLARPPVHSATGGDSPLRPRDDSAVGQGSQSNSGSRLRFPEATSRAYSQNNGLLSLFTGYTNRGKGGRPEDPGMGDVALMNGAGRRREAVKDTRHRRGRRCPREGHEVREKLNLLATTRILAMAVHANSFTTFIPFGCYPLEPTSSLERNRMHGSSTKSLGPAFPRVSRSLGTYARSGSALSVIHEQSIGMMLDSRGMLRYAPPNTSLVAP
ncbi:hypothetical protein ARMGADRAFT_1039883 [Armillaria gallica]|uniref:Uncharacterized protein n=1 Tax=Armillaria gallica TaxID=47427 RepID=A0A2H3CHB0_ARMGA|nr:hypothetical protein ARMGADRAFT_1039883 [Armillaria gallica]